MPEFLKEGTLVSVKPEALECEEHGRTNQGFVDAHGWMYLALGEDHPENEAYREMEEQEMGGRKNPTGEYFKSLADNTVLFWYYSEININKGDK